MTAAKPVECIGVVGLGLMGRGIASCLLAHGYRVIGLDHDAAVFPRCREHAEGVFRDLREHDITTPDDTDGLRLTTELADFASCDVVIESIVENLDAKRDLLTRLETVVTPEAVLASNTSSLPISILQRGMNHPQRIAGMHWGEPCHVLRFLEVIQGEQTAPAAAETLRAIGERCGKDVVMVRKDVRGFITNRLFYALLREAFHLVESGVGSAEDIDAAFRNDIAVWAGIAGPFRYLDLTGLPAYLEVMKDLLPELNADTDPPALLRELVESGAEGISNGRGFYRYTPEQAGAWEHALRDIAWAARRFSDDHIPGGKQESS